MTLRTSAFLLAGVLAAGRASAADPTPAGQSVYSENCVLCHGPQGSPSEPMKKLGVADLSSPKWQASRTDDQIRKIVSDGKPDTLMRAFRDELGEDDIAAVVKYVRTLDASKKK
jgi:mono/diheme cytochrome c family protein